MFSTGEEVDVYGREEGEVVRSGLSVVVGVDEQSEEELREEEDEGKENEGNKQGVEEDDPEKKKGELEHNEQEEEEEGRDASRDKVGIKVMIEKGIKMVRVSMVV